MDLIENKKIFLIYRMNKIFKILIVMIIFHFQFILSLKITSRSKKENDKKNLKKFDIESIIEKSQTVRDLVNSNEENDKIKDSINSLLNDLEYIKNRKPKHIK